MTSKSMSKSMPIRIRIVSIYAVMPPDPFFTFHDYHSSGYLITENIANMFAFSEFCNAFELGSEISVNPLYRPTLIEDLLKQQKEKSC